MNNSIKTQVRPPPVLPSTPSFDPDVIDYARYGDDNLFIGCVIDMLAVVGALSILYFAYTWVTSTWGGAT